MDIRSALDQIVIIEKTVSIATPQSITVNKAYKTPPPENQGLPDLPCFINTVTLPDERRHAAMRWRLYTVTVQLLIKPYTVEADVSTDVALALLEATMAAFDGKQTLSGTVSMQKLRGGTPVVAKLTWAGITYVGLNLLLDLSMIDGGAFGP